MKYYRHRELLRSTFGIAQYDIYFFSILQNNKADAIIINKL